MDQGRFETLTSAEREVLEHVAAGLRAGEIAVALDRSINTINNHLKSARQKLGTSDSLTAARAFVAHEAPSQKVTSKILVMVTAAQAGEREASAAASVEQGCAIQEERSEFIGFPAKPNGPRNPLTWPARLAIMAGTLVLIGMALLQAIPLVRSAQEIGRYINTR